MSLFQSVAGAVPSWPSGPSGPKVKSKAPVVSSREKEFSGWISVNL